MRTIAAYRHGQRAGDVAAAHGLTDVVKLSSNESAFGPLPSVVTAIERETADVHRYPDPGCTELRDDLSARIGVPAELIHVGPGSGAVLTQLILATVTDGDRMLSPWPSFELYPIMAQLAGAEFVAVPLRDQTADVDAIVARLDERSRLVVIANPNNPTGTALPPPEIERLLAAVAPSCLLVVDEAYADFSVTRPESGLPTLVAHHPNLVVTRTFSKLHGLASLRIGYAVASGAVVEQMSRLPPPFSVNGLALAAATASLAAEPELATRRRAVADQRHRLVNAIRQLGWAVPPPAGNFVWVACGDAAADLGLHLETGGVVTRVFDGEGVRITVGTAEENTRLLAAFPRRRPTSLKEGLRWPNRSSTVTWTVSCTTSST